MCQRTLEKTRRWRCIRSPTCLCCLVAIPVLAAALVDGAVHKRLWCRYTFWTCAWAFVSTRDRLSPPRPDPQYQVFLDTFPFSRYSLDVGQRALVGPVRSERLPAFMDRFDWLVDAFPYASWESTPPEIADFARRLGKTPDVRRARDPASVFAAPHALAELCQELEGLPPASPSRPRALLIGGTDRVLTDALGRDEEERAATLAKLRTFFTTIRVEAKDAAVEGIGAMPLGLPEVYYRKQLDVPATLASIRNASLARKPLGVLAPGGAFFGKRCANVDRMNRVSCESREDLKEWVASPAARAAGVDARSVAPQAWWEELAKYRFVLAPLGGGIQTAKMIEALLVLTIPIVQRGPYVVFDDLVALGFPIVVVDRWDEVAQPGKLAAWHAELSPRLERFRESCLSTDGYWRLATGKSGGRCGD